MKDVILAEQDREDATQQQENYSGLGPGTVFIK